MILLDDPVNHSLDKDDTRFHGSTVRLPERVAGRSIDSQSLPDYDTSEQQHKVHQQPRSLKSWRPTRTFWKAAVSALAVYIVLSIAICTPFIVKEMRKKRFLEATDPNSFTSYLQYLSNGPDVDERRPWDFSNLTCQRLSPQMFNSSTVTSGGQTYYSTTLKYETLPVASHVRSNITRGNTQPGQFDGSLNVAVATDVNQRLLKYQVTVNTTRGEPLEYTSLCFTETPGLHGLSIFPTKPYTGDEELSIQIEVIVPPTRLLRGFTAYLPDFKQNIRDLQTGYVHVEGANKPIVFHSVQAREVGIRNLLAPFQGTLNVSYALGVDVIGGSVDAEVIVYCPDGREEEPSIDFNGIDSPLTINLVLDSQYDDIPTFLANVHSTNGTIDMDITKTPVTPAPVLVLDVESARADTLVKMADYLGGWYDVGSRIGSVHVNDFVGGNYMKARYTAAQKAVGLFENPASPPKSPRGQFKIRSTFGQASLAFTKSS